MTEEEEKAVEFVKKRTKELKKYARREDETTYDDIVLNLVNRLLKENEELKEYNNKHLIEQYNKKYPYNRNQINKIWL